MGRRLDRIEPDGEILTAREVAERLRVAVTTVRRWGVRDFPKRPNGEPGCFQTPGGHFRYHGDAVDVMIARGRRPNYT